jgi:hypothetical protein
MRTSRRAVRRHSRPCRSPLGSVLVGQGYVHIQAQQRSSTGVRTPQPNRPDYAVLRRVIGIIGTTELDDGPGRQHHQSRHPQQFPAGVDVVDGRNVRRLSPRDRRLGVVAANIAQLSHITPFGMVGRVTGIRLLLYFTAVQREREFEKCVELRGLEPLAFWMQTRRSSS